MPQLTYSLHQSNGPVSKSGLGFLLNSFLMPDGCNVLSLAPAAVVDTFHLIVLKRGDDGMNTVRMLPFADVEARKMLAAFERAVYEAA